MSVSHGYSTICEIEWWLWRRQKGEDSLTSTRCINGLWRCPSIEINVGVFGGGFHILVGIFHYRTWLVYSNDGLPQNALGLHEQASWMHTH